ncbi:MAG: chemotaxis protein CheW [Alphaproteobacteria bacterium]|nr:chemotaxis protein CheW [Alphaproteobacteria bacterium]
MKLDQAIKIDEAQFLTFCIGNEWFGLSAPTIKDVMYTPILTPVPLSSPEVAGLLNMRGHIVTAIHSGLFFDIPTSKTIKKNMCIVLQDNDDELYSFIVDKVHDIESWPINQYEPLPLNLANRWNAYADGVYRLEGRLVVILNKEKLLQELREY